MTAELVKFRDFYMSSSILSANLFPFIMSSWWWLVHHLGFGYIDLQTKVFGRRCKASDNLLCVLVVVYKKGSVVR